MTPCRRRRRRCRRRRQQRSGAVASCASILGCRHVDDGSEARTCGLSRVARSKREPIGDLEPGRFEALGCAREQGGAADGDRRPVRRGDVVEAGAHLVDVGDDRVVAEPDVDQGAVAGRWAHHQRPQCTRGPNVHCVPRPRRPTLRSATQAARATLSLRSATQTWLAPRRSQRKSGWRSLARIGASRCNQRPRACQGTVARRRSSSVSV